MRTVLAVWVALLALTAAPGVAEAKQSTTYEYRFSQVWSAAFRLIRVDLECRVTDRDDELGFVMFEYKDGDRTVAGSAQLVQLKERGKEVVRVELQIAEMPAYIEIMILDKLGRKLFEEFGDPVVAPSPAPPGNNDGEKKPEDGPKDKPGDGGKKGPAAPSKRQ